MRWLHVYADRLYFNAYDALSGMELWSYSDLNVGVEDALHKPTSFVYPNPANNVLHIEANFKGQAELEFYTMTGDLVENHLINSTNGTATIDLSPMNNGVYLVVLCTEDRVFTDRLIYLE